MIIVVIFGRVSMEQEKRPMEQEKIPLELRIGGVEQKR
jgi:hypothetical protein